MKSRRMRWAWHVAYKETRIGAYRCLVERPEGRYYLGDLGVNGRIIMKWMFKTWDGAVWIGIIWIRIGICGGFWEIDIKPSGFIERGEILIN